MDHSASNGPKPTWVVSSCDVLFDGDAIRIDFVDAAFVFHSQWLHDAKCDTGPSRTAVTAYCSKPAGARIIEAHVGNAATTLEAKWQDESMSSFPAVWLRVHGPLVGKACSDKSPQQVKEPEGWLAATLRIPSVDYHDIFSTTEERCSVVAEQVLDILLMSPETGIIKVTGLPPPDVECERRKINTLVTRVLKKLFGSVFQHSRRAAETTFNVASHRDEDTKRGDVLVNYNTTQVLLPHADHAHYQHPVQVQGFYCLEGESENTFVSGLRALRTLQEEAPDLYKPLVTSQMAVGRTVHYYDPPLRQGTVDTPVTFQPGTSAVKRFRWHAHLTGSLVTPFEDFPVARAAHQKLQEIMRRESHLLKVRLQPGDLYIWNNFTILHGRERVFETPRTGVGQTVPEQVVADRYRAIKMEALREHLEEDWLIHMPLTLLYQMIELIKGY
ncbi:unnamed protein product [Calypogeia fissa]